MQYCLIGWHTCRSSTDSGGDVTRLLVESYWLMMIVMNVCQLHRSLYLLERITYVCNCIQIVDIS